APDADAEQADADRPHIIDATIEADIAKRAAEQATAAASKSPSDPDAINGAKRAALDAEAITIPVEPKLIADDITPEAAKTLLAEQSEIGRASCRERAQEPVDAESAEDGIRDFHVTEFRRVLFRSIAKRAAEQATAAASKSPSDPDAINGAKRAALDAEAITIPVEPKLIADDITPEAAKTLLAEQS